MSCYCVSFVVILGRRRVRGEVRAVRLTRGQSRQISAAVLLSLLQMAAAARVGVVSPLQRWLGRVVFAVGTTFNTIVDDVVAA